MLRRSLIFSHCIDSTVVSGDHNKIRDAIMQSEKHAVGSDGWWKAVGQARKENSEHLAEEEDEALPDFRRHSTDVEREQLGERWLQFYREHPKGKGLNLRDEPDPDEYVEQQKTNDEKSQKD
jgi:hypothetical protein